MPKRGEAFKPLSKWEKAFTRDAEWTLTELSDVVHWARQLFALICGVIWGFLALQGANAILPFLLLNATIIFVYYSKFLGADDEELGRWELIQEGFMTSFAVFLITWIFTYNLLHI